MSQSSPSLCRQGSGKDQHPTTTLREQACSPSRVRRATQTSWASWSSSIESSSIASARRSVSILLFGTVTCLTGQREAVSSRAARERTNGRRVSPVCIVLDIPSLASCTSTAVNARAFVWAAGVWTRAKTKLAPGKVRVAVVIERERAAVAVSTGG